MQRIHSKSRKLVITHTKHKTIKQINVMKLICHLHCWYIHFTLFFHQHEKFLSQSTVCTLYHKQIFYFSSFVLLSLLVSSLQTLCRKTIQKHIVHRMALGLAGATRNTKKLLQVWMKRVCAEYLYWILDKCSCYANWCSMTMSRLCKLRKNLNLAV